MASIRRQQITRYLLNGSRVTNDGKPVTKDTPGAVKTVEFSAKWYAYDVPGHSKPIPLATNEKVSRRMLDNIIRDGERGIAGMPTARVLALSDYLEQFSDQFKAGMATRSKRKQIPCEKQHHQQMHWLRHTFAAVEILEVNDLNSTSARKLSGWLHHCVKVGEFSAQTAQHRLAICRRFVWWLNEKARAPIQATLFDDIPGFSPSANRTREPAAFTVEETQRLLDQTASHEEYCGLTGTERRYLYLTALMTGYRADELSRLGPDNFLLDQVPPVIHLPARDTKAKRLAIQPIPAVVAVDLKQWLATRPEGKPVWPGGSWNTGGAGGNKNTARMLRWDLEKIGIPATIKTPGSKATRNFHSLRHTYITRIAEGGASVKDLQELARHSDPRLTIGIYSHTTHDRLATLVNTMAQQTAKVTEKAESGRFFLDQDDDGHWYIVPVVHRDEWEAWCEIDEYDERSMTPPPFAREVDGSNSRVTFLSPEIE